jgi:membrane associated rhomboid family serine protease
MIPCRGRCCAVKDQSLASPTNSKRSWNHFVFSFSVACCVLQVAAFAAAVVYAGGFMPASENPGWGPYPYFLNVLGAKNAARILVEGEWWRLVSPLLLHSSVGHLVVNLIIQARLVVSLEQRWGHCRWLVVYICAGAYSTLASCVYFPDSLSVGSSGAICGVLGAGLLYMFVTWRQTELQDVMDRNVEICSFVVTIVAIGILSVLPMADFAAHAGGFVIGLLLAMVLFAECLEKENTKIADRIRSVGCFLLATLVSLTLAYFVWKVEPDRKLLTICRPSEC